MAPEKEKGEKQRLRNRSLLWFKNVLRANFFAGLFVVIPLGITIWIFWGLWDWLDQPMADLFQKLTGKGGEEIGRFLAPFFGLLLVLAIILVIGFVTRVTVGRWVLRLFEWVMTRLPVAGVIYTSVKQIGQAILTVEGESKFEGAVMVEFPSPGTWAVGFVTGRAEGVMDTATKDAAHPDDERLMVFVPMTPLPSAGFMLVVKRREVRHLPLSVPDAFKLVVSGGIIAPGQLKQLPGSETNK